MKKIFVLPFIAFLAGALALVSSQEINQVDASYDTKIVFEDRFDTNEIKEEWIQSGEVELCHKYSSMRLNPDAYNWESSVNLNRLLSGKYSVSIELSSSNNSGWFAIAFGNVGPGFSFTSMKGGVVFFNNNYSKVLDCPEDKLDSLGDYAISAFSDVLGSKRKVLLTVDDVDENRSSLQCEIFENNRSLGTMFESPYVFEYKLEGYMGFNSNLKNVEIYSVEVKDGSGQVTYSDNFSSSSVLYPSSGSVSSEWYSINFGENELKVGYISSLSLSDIGAGLTYINPISKIDDADIDVGYILESDIQYMPMDFDVESGFEIARSEDGNNYHFFGVRKQAIGYSLIHYDNTGSVIDKFDCANENDDLSVHLSIEIKQNGEVDFKCGELEFSIVIEEYAGFVGISNKNILKNREHGAGAYFNSFKLRKNNYLKRDASDVYINFNGTKRTYFEDIDEYAYDYFLSRQEWNIGARVSTSKWKRSDNGNGKLEFNGSAGNSYFGPKNMYKDFVVRFDVEVTSSVIPHGGTLGLQFGNSRPGLYYENTKSLGIGYYPDTTGTYRSVPSPLNVNYVPGASDVFYDEDGNITNIYEKTRKFTLMYIARNNVVSLYYLLEGEDKSNLNILRTAVITRDEESTDGYLAVFGANGISFTIDNLSIINLDLDAPVCEYKGNSDYQEVTRVDFTKQNDMGGLVSSNEEISPKGKIISDGGEIKTSKLVNDNILRLKVDDIGNILSIKEGTLDVRFINQNVNKRIEVVEGNVTQTYALSNDFAFKGSTIELEKLGKKLTIRMVGGNSSLSLFGEDEIVFDVALSTDSVLSIGALNGNVTLLSLVFINLNDSVTIANRDYDPAIDDYDPWPYRPTNDSSAKHGCAGGIESMAFTMCFIAASGILVAISYRRRIEK